MDNLKKTIAEWVRLARKAAKLSQDELGTRLTFELGDGRGFTKGNISHWETQKHSPNVRQLIAISKITGTALPQEIVSASMEAEVEDGDTSGIPLGGHRVGSSDDEDAGGVVVPVVNIRVSAGVTGFVAEELPSERKWNLEAGWLMSKGFSPKHLVGAIVKGPSMETSLFEGDRILINLRSVKPKPGPAFVVNFDGEACVKRLENGGGQWYLVSDNPAWPRINMRSKPCFIIGEVVKKESDHI